MKARDHLDVRGLLSRQAHFTFLVISVGLLWSSGRIQKISEWPTIVFLVAGFFGFGMLLHFVESIFLAKKKSAMWDMYDVHGPQVLQDLAPRIALTSNLLALLSGVAVNLLFVLILGR